jgi:RND family efflux transporter MFP subunit
MNRLMTLSSLAASAALVWTAGAMTACSRSQAQSGVAETPPAVAVAKVARGDIAQALTVAADFSPYQEIDLHAKVSGYVKTISVDVGDRVKAGQLLAVLEVPELRDELDESDAGVRRAQEEINRAQADLDRAEFAHDVAHLGSTRLSGVLKARPNLVAQQDVDEAAGRDRVAEAQATTAKATLASARQQLDIAKAAQNKTKTLVGYSQITAPFAGVITHRYADVGAMIQAGTSSQTQTMPLVRLSQNDVLRLVIRAPESATARIHLGQPVSLTVHGLERTVAGKVARFSDRLDTDTRTMRVEVDVPNPDYALVPGMYVDASIVLNEAKDALVVPVEAVDRTQASPRIFVVTPDHRVNPRVVTTGLESGDRVQLTGGAEAGDLVVVGSRAQLKAGAMVSPKVIGPTPTVTGGVE